MPDEIADMTRKAADAVREFGAEVGIHCHNDCDLAVANSLAAVEAGAVQVQGTINGFGERCGNADLISVIPNLGLKKQGYQVLGGQNLDRLTELSRYVYEIANMNFRNEQPFVGPSAFAHKGGMHVHAVARATSSYEHIAPEAVGNERRILVSELSGRSNIVALTTQHNIQHDRELMEKILGQVVKMESEGYQFEAAGATFDLLVKRCVGEFRPHFERLKYHVEVSADAGTELLTEATVKLRIGDRLRHEVAEGDGPVNALDAALRKALNGSYPFAQRYAAGRLPRAGGELGSGYCRPYPSGDRERRLETGVGHGGREREYHRSQLDGVGRCLRVQTAPRRTGSRSPTVNLHAIAEQESP